jgi:hypothetical protein
MIPCCFTPFQVTAAPTLMTAMAIIAPADSTLTTSSIAPLAVVIKPNCTSGALTTATVSSDDDAATTAASGDDLSAVLPPAAAVLRLRVVVGVRIRSAPTPYCCDAVEKNSEVSFKIM